MDGSIALYGRLAGARIRSDASYRASFILRIVSSALITVADFVGIAAILNKVGTIGGWNAWQVTYLFGASSTAFRLADAIVGGPVERVAQLVRKGTFDKFLVRPRSSLLQVMGEDFAFRRLGQCVAVAPFLVVSLLHVGVDWSVATAMFFVFQLAGAVLLFASIFVIVCCIAFWSPETKEVANAFTYGGSFVAQYPVHVMAPWIRSLVFTLVPVAFTAYLPAFVLFDAPNPLGIPRWASYAAPLAFVPFGALACWFWKFAVGHYRSTGS